MKYINYLSCPPSDLILSILKAFAHYKLTIPWALESAFAFVITFLSQQVNCSPFEQCRPTTNLSGKENVIQFTSKPCLLSFLDLTKPYMLKQASDSSPVESALFFKLCSYTYRAQIHYLSTD